LGGTFKSPPTITSWSTNRLDIFAVGTDDIIYHISYDSRWLDWKGVSGPAESEVAVVVSDVNQLDWFAIGLDDGLWHRNLTGNTWGPLTPLGGICNSAPAVVSTENKGISAFCIGTDGGLHTQTLQAGQSSGWFAMGGRFALSL
jgi:hypothetical protein